MKQKIICCAVVSLLLSSQAVISGEVPLDIKTDIKGQYLLVEQGGDAKRPTLVVRRITPGGRSAYVKREFDCATKMVRRVASGEGSPQQMVPIQPESEMSPIVANSINEQLLHLACPEQGTAATVNK